VIRASARGKPERGKGTDAHAEISDFWAADASARCMPAASTGRWCAGGGRRRCRFPTAARRWPRNRRAVMSPDEIIASPDIDAVVIGTPTDTHFDLIQKRAKAGKAIFCEKPVDMSVRPDPRLHRRRRRRGRAVPDRLQPALRSRLRGMRARIAAGEIGDVELVTILSRDPARRRFPISRARAGCSGT
jgi:predicted dehydrogenase